MTATQIAIAVVQSSSDDFLIGPRDKEKVLGGYWEFPGGKVESNESPEAAAARECREETGLDVSVERLLLRQTHSYAHGDVDLHFYHCRPLDKAEPNSPFRWVKRGMLANFEFPSGNAPLLAMLAVDDNS